MKKKKAKIHDVNSIVKYCIKLRENEKLWDFDPNSNKSPPTNRYKISVQLDKATTWNSHYLVPKAGKLNL